MTLRTFGLVGMVVCYAIGATHASALEPAVQMGPSHSQMATAQPLDTGDPDFLTSPPPRPAESGVVDVPVTAQTDQCRWLGTRIISLLSRDDAMTAKDFNPFYERFGCPEAHLARAFGCVVGGGGPAQGEELASRVDRCWAHPNNVRSRPTELLGEAKSVPELDAGQRAGGT